MSYSPGQEVVKYTTFIDSAGERIDVDPIFVDIIGPDNSIVLNDGIPERISEGHYEFTYQLENDAELGTWRIEWRGNVGSAEGFGYETFEVKAFVDEETANDFLRARLGEPKAEDDEDGSETFFTDTQIADLLTYADDNYDIATLEGWRRKLARYSRLIDVNESGTSRDLSQKFKHAEAMVKYWDKILGDGAILRQKALAGRVVGKPVNLGLKIDSLALLTPFSGYSENIRMYATHRLIIPAIISGGTG